MRFVRKRTGGAKTGVDTAASARRNLGHALDVYEECKACFSLLRNADAAACATSEGAGTRR